MKYKGVYVDSFKRDLLARMLDFKEVEYMIDDELLNFVNLYDHNSTYFFYIKSIAALTFGPEAYECVYTYQKNLDVLAEKIGFASGRSMESLESFIWSSVDIADSNCTSNSLEQFKQNWEMEKEIVMKSLRKDLDKLNKKEKYIQPYLDKISESIIKIWDLARYAVFINTFPTYNDFIKKVINTSKDEKKQVVPEKKAPNKKQEEAGILESKVKNFENEIKKTVKGQDKAIEEIANVLSLKTSGISERLPVIYIFLGPTGVGKTYLTREINKYLFEGKKKLFEMSGSNFYDKHLISKLIGSPAGYIGYDQEAGLAKHVKQNPGASIILFDEFEKAHSSIWDIILTYADTGIIQDSKNNDLDLKDTIMIMTGNVGNSDFKKKLGFLSENLDKQMEKHVKSSFENLFRPELKGRVNLVYFDLLSDEAKNQILELETGYAMKRLNDKRKINLEISEPLRKYLLEHGFDEKKGARGLKDMLKNTLFVPLSKFILEKDAKESTILSDYDGDVKFCLASQSTAQSSPESAAK